MSIKNVGGDQRTLKKDSYVGDQAHKLRRSPRSQTAQKVRKATDDVLDSLRKIGQFTKRVGDDLNHMSRHRLLNPASVSLQNGFVNVKHSIESCLSKVLHFVESKLQAHLERKDDRQMQKNIKNFKLFLRKFKANHPILKRTKHQSQSDEAAIFKSESTEKSAANFTDKNWAVDYRQSIEQKLSELSSQLNLLNVELKQACENCAPSSSSSATGASNGAGAIERYVTSPKLDRDIFQEFKTLQSLIEANQRELAAFDAHSAKLLGAEKKAENAARSHRVFTNKAALNKKQLELGEKKVTRLVAGAERRKLLLQQRRDKLSSYAEKVRKAGELAPNGAKKTKQEIQRIEQDRDRLEVDHKEMLSKLESEIAAHKAQDRPDGLIQSWYHTQKEVDLEKKYSGSQSDFKKEMKRYSGELHGIVAERKSAQEKSNRDFDRDNKLHLQFSKEIHKIAYGVIEKLSYDDLAQLYGEGLQVVQRAQMNPENKSAVLPAGRNVAGNRSLVIDKQSKRSFLPQKVRKIVFRAFVTALEDEHLAKPESKKNRGWFGAISNGIDGTKEFLWGKIHNKTFRSEVVKNIAGSLSLRPKSIESGSTHTLSR